MRKLYLITVLFFSTSLFASQLFYQKIALQDLIRQSPVIVTARPVKPFTVIKKVKIRCSILKQTTLELYREKFVIEQVLRGTYPGLTNQAVITVRQADENRTISISKLYECRGITESYILDSYCEDKAFPVEESRVLFLYPSQGDYTYTMINARESLDQIPLIQQIILGNHPEPQLQHTPVTN